MTPNCNENEWKIIWSYISGIADIYPFLSLTYLYEM
jgi:hypothetical protein